MGKGRFQRGQVVRVIDGTTHLVVITQKRGHSFRVACDLDTPFYVGTDLPSATPSCPHCQYVWEAKKREIVAQEPKILPEAEYNPCTHCIDSKNFSYCWLDGSPTYCGDRKRAE